MNLAANNASEILAKFLAEGEVTSCLYGPGRRCPFDGTPGRWLELQLTLKNLQLKKSAALVTIVSFLSMH